MNSTVFSFNQDLGSYLNGYFRLTINTQKDDFQRLDEDEMCTYVHEYVHFLQNITTTYGLFILSGVTRNAHLVTYGISQSAYSSDYNGKPYKKIDFNNTFIEQQNQIEDLITCTLGENGDSSDAKKINDKSDFYTLVGINESNFDEDVHLLKDSKKINVVYEHSISNETVEIEFGAVCIYECMAVLIEKHISKKNNISVPVVPYETAKDLAAYLCSGAVSDMLVCIVCELSLQSRCPGEDFVNLFKVIIHFCTEYDKKQTGNVEPIFDTMNHDYELAKKISSAVAEKYNYYITKPDGTTSKFDKKSLKTEYLDTVKEDFKDFIGSGVRSKISDLVEYILDSFNKDIDIIFISDFMNEKKGDPDKFNKFQLSRGTPLLFNNNGLVGHYLPEKCYDEQYLYLSILSDYYSSIRSEGHACSHYSTCQRVNGVVNDNCLNNTIAKANEDPLCPLGFLIKTYGMNL